MGSSVMENVLPKENINCVAAPELRTEVSWKADPDGHGSGYVQVATVHTDSRARIPSDPGPVTSGATEVTILVDGEPAPAGMSTTLPSAGRTELWEKLDGWHVTLDREQVNRLIRMLRRARDAAFGTDA